MTWREDWDPGRGVWGVGAVREPKVGGALMPSPLACRCGPHPRLITAAGASALLRFCVYHLALASVALDTVSACHEIWEPGLVPDT